MYKCQIIRLHVSVPWTRSNTIAMQSFFPICTHFNMKLVGEKLKRKYLIPLESDSLNFRRHNMFRPENHIMIAYNKGGPSVWL